MKCRLCGRTANEIHGVLHRVNEKGVKGIWECRPICGAEMNQDDALLAAIEGTFDSETVKGEAEVPALTDALNRWWEADAFANTGIREVAENAYAVGLREGRALSVTTAAQPEAEFRFLTRDDAESFIKQHLHSAQWEGERLIVSFEREALIGALVEGDAVPNLAPPSVSEPKETE